MTSAQTTDVLEQERRRLFTLAYGLTGSRASAEDIVQEVWLRWHKDQSQQKREPAAWLTTVTTRLALDHLRSAQVRRETYPGVWLPEPVVEARSPETSLLMKSELTLAFLFLLERLGAEERAAFVLREVFDHSYKEIGELLGKTEAACRQMVKRSREKVRDDRPAPSKLDREEYEGTISRFLVALHSGDEQQLLQLLAEDAVIYGDGGGKAPAIINPVHGRERIVRLLLGLWKRFPDQFTAELVDVNGAPGLVLRRSEATPIVVSYVIEQGRVARIFHVINPEKLTALDS